VRRVGRQLKLPAAGLFHRQQRPQADRERTAEHGEQQNRRGEGLTFAQEQSQMILARQALPSDDRDAA